MTRTVDMTEFKDNPDGSATVTFDFNQEEIVALFRQGAIVAIKEGIKNAEAYNPEKTTRFQNKSIDLGWDTIEKIVIDELKDAYDTNVNLGSESIEGMKEALDLVLQWFMNPTEYEDWKKNV